PWTVSGAFNLPGAADAARRRSAVSPRPAVLARGRTPGPPDYQWAKPWRMPSGASGRGASGCAARARQWRGGGGRQPAGRPRPDPPRGPPPATAGGGGAFGGRYSGAPPPPRRRAPGGVRTRSAG